MAGDKHDWVADVAFVIAECARLMSMPWEEIRKLPRDELLPHLPHPGGKGHMLCGRAASERVEALADEAGRRARLTHRVRHQALREPVEELLVQRFVREKRPIDLKQVDRMLAASGKTARRSCADLRHLLPCHLMLAKDPDEITIGPVTFRNRAALRRQLLAACKGYSAVGDEAGRSHRRRLLTHALRYYRTFNWAAEVEIKGCDPETSRRLAEYAVTSALNCLHLLFGARWTDRMRVGGPAIGRDRRAQLTFASSGELGVSVSWSGAGQVNFEDGWSLQLEDPEMQHFLRLIGVALETAVEPDFERPLSRRFLDAAQWFGEASRDDSPSTRVVKFVTSLERMVMTEEKDDITTLVSERVAALCFDKDGANREEWRAKTRTVYDLRSKLVHGAMSPRSPRVFRGVRLGAELAERTLLRALDAFGDQGLRTERVGVRWVAGWFGNVTAWADQVCEADRAAAPDLPSKPSTNPAGPDQNEAASSGGT